MKYYQCHGHRVQVFLCVNEAKFTSALNKKISLALMETITRFLLGGIVRGGELSNQFENH